MRERERPRAQSVEHPEHGEAGADRVARLHRDVARDLAGGVRGKNVCIKGHYKAHFNTLRYFITVCRFDELQLVWIGLGEPLDQVDLLERDLHGVLVLAAARRVRNP